MKIFLLAAILALQLTAAQSARLRWVPNPRVANGTWVADPSGHLRPQTVDSLNALISALERETGVEIAVVAIDSTSGFEPSDVALALHRTWGVGKQGRDNGIVLLWVPTQRAVQISVGYGLEGVLPDARAGRIRDQEIFPAFRREDFDAGMMAGVTALAAVAREEPNARGATMSTPGTSGPAGAVQPDDPPAGRNGGRAPAVVGGIGAGLAVLAAGAGAWRYRRRRPRKCPNGHGDMVRLDEEADDAHLDRGQRLEETLESVDYDVWVCPTCGHAIREEYKAWFSSYSECESCGRRTLEKSEKTLRAASTVSEGLKEITEICRNCDARRKYTRTIPRIVQSSSSSSSFGGSSGGGGGGSSFGGGSAGGGGAGGRY